MAITEGFDGGGTVPKFEEEPKIEAIKELPSDKSVPLLTDFIYNEFEDNERKFTFNKIRTADENLKLLVNFASITSLESMVMGEMPKEVSDIKTPILVITEMKKLKEKVSNQDIINVAAVIVTNADRAGQNTVEIFDPDLESYLVELANEYKSLYSKPGFEIEIEIKITPRLVTA